MATTSEDVQPDDIQVEGGGRVDFLTRAEELAIFDKVAHERLGMSGNEFLQRLDAGEFDGDERWEIAYVHMLLPLAQ